MMVKKPDDQGASADDILFGDQPRTHSGDAVVDADDGRIYRISGPLSESTSDSEILKPLNLEFYELVPGEAEVYSKVGAHSPQAAIEGGQLHRLEGPALTIRQPNSQARIEVWCRDGKLYRENGPGCCYYEDNGLLFMEKSFNEKGQLHRVGGAASCVYDEDGQPENELWVVEGLLHREGGPALIDYEGGQPQRDEWYQEGELHHTNGPALKLQTDQAFRHDSDWLLPTPGSLLEHPGFLHGPGEVWFEHDLAHRDGGPAITGFYDGRPVRIWLRNGILHNDAGPAVILGDPNGDDVEEQYWLDGEQVSEQDWKRQQRAP
jgi:hypothetical protein